MVERKDSDRDVNASEDENNTNAGKPVRNILPRRDEELHSLGDESNAGKNVKQLIDRAGDGLQDSAGNREGTSFADRLARLRAKSEKGSHGRSD